MDKKINLSGKLDFSEIDLTAPDKVVNELLAQLPQQTNGIIHGVVKEYDGPIESYQRDFPAVISVALSSTKEVDIQDSLGAIGESNKKFECYLFTEAYDHYKYRLFFMEHSLSMYPVKLVVENSIALSMSEASRKYIYTCGSRDILEDFVIDILTCKKTISVMQELIRIAQAKKMELIEATLENPAD